jgi:aminopeptidase N
MEHQTIIAYGNEFKLGPRGYPAGYDWLHHHELAHEWWANLVTCRDWKDMWIHEGIGTYMQALYLEKVAGKSAYHREMLLKGRHLNRNALAPRESMDSYEIYFTGANRDIYDKGAWVMHTLRWLLGDKKFFVALRRMAYPDPAMEKVTDGSCTRFTDTEEIREIAEQYGEMELDWFFAVYLRQPQVPRLIQHFDGGKLHLEWEVPIDVVFPMPVAVRINGKTTRLEMKDGKGAIGAGPDDEIAIDPEHWILKRRTRRKGD